MVTLGKAYMNRYTCLDGKFHEAYMVPTWGRQDPGGPMLAPYTLLSGWWSLSRVMLCRLVYVKQLIESIMAYFQQTNWKHIIMESDSKRTTYMYLSRKIDKPPHDHLFGAINAYLFTKGISSLQVTYSTIGIHCLLSCLALRWITYKASIPARVTMMTPAGIQLFPPQFHSCSGDKLQICSKAIFLH